MCTWILTVWNWKVVVFCKCVFLHDVDKMSENVGNPVLVYEASRLKGSGSLKIKFLNIF